jgi:hypothetical protein
VVVISIALQQRLLDAAARELGAQGEMLLAEATGQLLNRPFESLGYDQLPNLFAALEREMAALVGRASALALADDLERLRLQADVDLSARITDALAGEMGAIAAPFLATLCRALDVEVDYIHRGLLPKLAARAETEAKRFAGDEAAAAIGGAIEGVRGLRPPGFVPLLLEIAEEHAGPDGEQILREICTEHLKEELDRLTIDQLAALAGAVVEHGPAVIGPARTAAFLAAARRAIAEPGSALRARLLELARRQLGPAGTVFLRGAAERNGVPFEAIGYENLAWLGEVVRREAAALGSEREAGELARQIAGLLPEPSAVGARSATAGAMPRGGGLLDPLKGLRNAAFGWLRA